MRKGPHADASKYHRTFVTFQTLSGYRDNIIPLKWDL